MKTTLALLLSIVLVGSYGATVTRAQEAAAKPEATADEKKPAREPIYDTEADAKAEVAKAVAKARLQRKRVLAVFGGNWCGWCYKLHDLFGDDQDIARVLRNEYVPVWVNVDDNKELLKSFGPDNEKQGVPFLVVLDTEGNVVVNQNTGDLEEGDKHDPAKVRGFLEQWALERQNAVDVLAGAFDRAKSDDKRVLLHFGAPWCGWCGELERFLDQQSERFGKDYVVVKIDTDRMDQGPETLAKYCPEGGGIPWFAVLTPDGQVKVASDAAGSNVGYPVAPAEVDQFMQMLETTKQRLTDDDLAAIRAALEARAKEIKH